MELTRLCLIRHGETVWNARARIQGQLDVALSGAGHAQARALAGALAGERFDALYTSDLARARQTAQAIAQRLKLPVDSRAALRERHYGVFQSLTYGEARERHPDEYARHARREVDCDFRTGESLHAFAARVLEGIAQILAAHAGGRVLVVTHGGVLDIVHRRATGASLAAPRDFDIPNAAVNWIEVDGERWSILSWAQRSHLDEALDEPPG